jgi:hypothetical protein
MQETDLTGDLAVLAVQRQFLVTLRQELNAEMAELDAASEAVDAAYYSEITAIGSPELPIRCEPVPDEQFYSGHRPSLIEAPIAYYPNCSVFAYTATPQNTTDDSITWYNLALSVEIMVKTEGDDTATGAGDLFTPINLQAQEIVNIRCNRMTQAVHNVMLRNGTLDGMVFDSFADLPNVIVGTIFTRREEKGRGPIWFWQGASLRYQIAKPVTF